MSSFLKSNLEKEIVVENPEMVVEEEKEVTNEEQENNVQIKSGVVIYETEDGTLGVAPQGEVKLKDLTFFKKYFDEYVEAKWETILNNKGDE